MQFHRAIPLGRGFSVSISSASASVAAIPLGRGVSTSRRTAGRILGDSHCRRAVSWLAGVTGLPSRGRSVALQPLQTCQRTGAALARSERRRLRAAVENAYRRAPIMAGTDYGEGCARRFIDFLLIGLATVILYAPGRKPNAGRDARNRMQWRR